MPEIERAWLWDHAIRSWQYLKDFVDRWLKFASRNFFYTNLFIKKKLSKRHKNVQYKENYLKNQWSHNWQSYKSVSQVCHAISSFGINFVSQLVLWQIWSCHRVMQYPWLSDPATFTSGTHVEKPLRLWILEIDTAWLLAKDKSGQVLANMTQNCTKYNNQTWRATSLLVFNY